MEKNGCVVIRSVNSVVVGSISTIKSFLPKIQNTKFPMMTPNPYAVAVLRVRKTHETSSVYPIFSKYLLSSYVRQIATFVD